MRALIKTKPMKNVKANIEHARIVWQERVRNMSKEEMEKELKKTSIPHKIAFIKEMMAS